VVRLCRYTVAQETDCGPIKKMQTLVNFQELPVIGTEPPERADAARNRRRILAAAEKLFAENGVSCTSMDAIAAEAGVGKGTLFRRFGDRASLARSLLSERDTEFQDAFIRGEPPLGPGAPPAERLVAFGEGMLDLLEKHGDLLFVAEGGDPSAQLKSDAWAAYHLHVRTLVAEAAPDLDEEVCAGMLLSALSARTFFTQRRARGMELERLKAGWGSLVRRLLF
jgi:AcrR family transcriptional regulator